MKTENIINIYPNKTLMEVFKDRENVFVTLGSNLLEFEKRRHSYQSFFDYDKKVIELKSILKTIEDIDDFVGERISNHFNNILEIKNQLETLDTSQPKDLNQIFQGFERFIIKKHYNEIVSHRVGGVDIIIPGVSLIKLYINELDQIIDNLNRDDLNIEDLEKAKKTIDQLVKNQQKYSDALVIAENRIEVNGKVESIVVQDRSQIFSLKAKTHKSLPLWNRRFPRKMNNTNRRRFIGGLIFGGIGVGVILYFIEDDANSISIGSALLRISLLIISSYFAFFCLQEFTKDRKLKEVYEFKELALRTMDDLLKSYTDQQEKEFIFSKALDIIFTEPKLDEKTMVQQKYVDDLIEIAKKNS